MSWGWKITFTFIGFIGLMAYLVIGSFQQNIDLVSEDYYEHELNYQDRIDHKVNASNLENNLQIKQENKRLAVGFPAVHQLDKISGEIKLYRPSNAGLDKTISIEPNEDGWQFLDKKDLVGGLYKVQVHWSDGTQKYYKEEKVMIN